MNLNKCESVYVKYSGLKQYKKQSISRRFGFVFFQLRAPATAASLTRLKELWGGTSGGTPPVCPQLVEKRPERSWMHMRLAPTTGTYHLHFLIVFWGKHGSRFVWEDTRLGLKYPVV